MCDLSFTIQVEMIERQALAQMMLAPHVEDAGQIPTPDVAIEEFQRWLVSDLAGRGRLTGDAELLNLIGVR